MKNNRSIIAIGITCAFCWACAFLATHVLVGYAFGLFFWLPFVMGASVTLLYGYNSDASKRQLRNASFLALFIFCLGMLTFAWEGIICIAMAAPIGLLFTWLGYLTAYTFLKNRKTPNVPATVLLLFISVPAFMGFEASIKQQDEVRSVTTSVEINASPEVVWKNVVQFPKLAEPDELVFRTGIAYPISATIEGEGVGAIRHCNFSTGSFTEPITEWNKPTLLAFGVTEQPEPMKELSPYNIHPNHLHGFWVSKHGQFKLIPLANGHTLLEGTTWYVNKIKPDLYWTIWSDFIVHKIHQRVLNHIKVVSE